jgi:NodT family efflux transporter outer membrane factor (OMF) lipoprotein
MMFPNRVFVLVAGLLGAGCSFFPPLGSKRMKADLAALNGTAPDKWVALPKVPQGAATGWLSDFGSSRLESMVNQAIKANPDLQAAAARVRQARAQAVQEGASLFPQVSAGSLASRAQSPSDQRFAGINQIANRFSWTVNVAWDVDFWGVIADGRRAAVARAMASDETWHAARLSLAANTVQTAVTLAEAESLQRLAEENIRVRKTQLGILERQLDRGLDPERAALDVSLSRADLARAESTLQQRRRTVDETRRMLETLMGGYPAGREQGMGGLPSIRRAVPAGLPSEMLLRRPDLRAAERRVAASLADESSAKKALLPSFRITGSFGRTTQEIEKLIRPETALWNIASQAAQTLFQGGRLKAGIDLERARYDENLQTYAGSVLTAFREVETALAAEQFLSAQESALQQAAMLAEQSEKLALGQYEKGLSEVLTLLDTRQRAFDARSALIAVQAQRLRNRAALHLALGGEFSSSTAR